MARWKGWGLCRIEVEPFYRIGHWFIFENMEGVEQIEVFLIGQHLLLLSQHLHKWMWGNCGSVFVSAAWLRVTLFCGHWPLRRNTSGYQPVNTGVNALLSCCQDFHSGICDCGVHTAFLRDLLFYSGTEITVKNHFSGTGYPGWLKKYQIQFFFS